MKVSPVQVDDQTTILIELNEDQIETVEANAAGGTVAAGDAAKNAIQKFDQVSDAISSVCRSVQAKVNSSLQDAMPNELTLEFGVTLTAESGFPLVVKGSAEATFQITAKWVQTELTKN